jgi:hypothetical protein
MRSLEGKRGEKKTSSRVSSEGTFFAARKDPRGAAPAKSFLSSAAVRSKCAGPLTVTDTMASDIQARNVRAKSLCTVFGFL